MTETTISVAPRAVPVTVHKLPSWTVVDGMGLPVEEVEQFLHWMRAVDRSVNSVRSYALHLSLFFRWLSARGIAWDTLSFEGLCDFVGALSAGLPPLVPRGGGTRSAATVKAINAAVREFYEFHRVEGRGPAGLVLTRNPARAPVSSRSFLAHVDKRRPPAQSRLVRRAKTSAVPVIDFESDFAKLLAAAATARDRVLLSAMYDVGLRVGQALGLRHEDLDPMRRQVRITRRADNVNGALSKQRDDFTVDTPRRFFDLYAEYLLEEFSRVGVDSDYVFVNLSRRPVGKPLSYSNAQQLVARIGASAEIAGLHPHTLRHTHATALAKAGWTAPEIAARLGQSHASSADVYIHLAGDDLAARLRETEHLVWRPLSDQPGGKQR
ncbi:tyrosine-type recombinase/integrase [Mycobacteroides chelonae]|uniref:tyrosine-type recombinase/integrase n=1 Tax=Mycobacteroides chelonae TaxID=1774 RepID=UPI0018B01757|nr:tyrosine-type recombinase/integrase [Mycobacteroides chelonae]MBF9318025.1 tyrosine-type recombinase/integrase [Mycobacteroides chelonae]